MSFWIMIIILLFAGILGGTVNYLLPANNSESGKRLSPWKSCVLLGLGASLLVPLFLEIAQSKLLDNISLSWSCPSNCKSRPNAGGVWGVSDTITIKTILDSTGKKILKSDTVKSKNAASENVSGNKTEQPASNTGKNYLLWAAYCLLASAAGFRFINMLINNVVKNDKITEQQNKIGELEKENDKRTKNSQISQQKEDEKIRIELLDENISEMKNNLTAEKAPTDLTIPLLPPLPPVTNANDPQKGRFGGKAEVNNRKISATVRKSETPSFYHVILTVESTNPDNPLNSDVIFYIHDSFSPSVYRIVPDEFEGGKAIDDEILSYGAFTAGVITDNGKTMLELDLSEDKRFPKQFRQR